MMKFEDNFFKSISSLSIFADSLLMGSGWLCVVSLVAELCLILSCGFAAVLTMMQFIAVEDGANQQELTEYAELPICRFYVVMMPQ